MLQLAEHYVHGRGRGHMSRAAAVARALRQAGLAVRLHAAPDAMDLVGTDDAAVSICARQPLLPGPLAPAKLARRVASDVARLRRQRPALVTSDGDQSALLAARVLGIPTIAIGHDLVFSGDVELPPLPTWALAAQRINAWPTRAAKRAIAVHFLPISSREPCLDVARPESIDPKDAKPADGRVVCYFRDDNGLPIVHGLAKTGVEVHWYGPSARSQPGFVGHALAGDTFRAALASCSAVVASAGSNLLAECVLLNKPVLALHRSGDSEQLLNASLIEAANVGMRATFGKVEQDLLQQFVKRAAAKDFAQVPLALEMPPLSAVLGRTLAMLPI